MDQRPGRSVGGCGLAGGNIHLDRRADAVVNVLFCGAIVAPIGVSAAREYAEKATQTACQQS